MSGTGDQSGQPLTRERAGRLVRQLWAVLLAARYQALTPEDEKEVHQLCHELSQGVAGFERFNSAAVRLCQRVTSLRGRSAYDAARLEGLLMDVDYLRALAQDPE